MGQCYGKKKYGNLKNANRGRMNLWGSDPSADLNDLHVYRCPVCGFYHVGHKSKYEEYLNDKNSKSEPESNSGGYD